MSAVRKIVSVKPNHFPSLKVKAKVKKTLLDNSPAKFLTRKDLATLAKDKNFAKAPNTVKFFTELKAKAKKAGAYYVRIEA